MTEELAKQALAHTEIYTQLITKIQDTLIKNGAKLSTGKRASRCKAPPWWDQECAKIVSERTGALKRYLSSFDVQEYIKYKELDALTKKITKKKKRSYRRKALNDITPDKGSGKIWDMIKRMKGVNNAPKSISEEHINQPELMRMVGELCEEPTISVQGEIPHNRVHCLDKKISLQEYMSALKLLKNKSSPGSDYVSNEILKLLPINSHNLLLKCFNGFLEEGNFPKEWSNYIVIMIPKPAGKGFRPISLAQNSFKLFENIVKRRLDWFIENEVIIPKSQFGFRKSKSGNESSLHLAADISYAMAKKMEIRSTSHRHPGSFQQRDSGDTCKGSGGMRGVEQNYSICEIHVH